MKFPDSIADRIEMDASLADRTWLGIGGTARYLFHPRSLDELISVAGACVEANEPLRVLGGGSNLLVRDGVDGVDGVVVSLDKIGTGSPDGGDAPNDVVWAGQKLSDAVLSAVAAGRGGLEHLIGIPGTVGGAIVTNANAGGRDIGSAVVSVDVLDANRGEIETVASEDIKFAHRTSSLGDRPIVSAKFRWTDGDERSLTQRMQKLWINRRRSQPGQQDAQPSGEQIDPTKRPRMAMPFTDPDAMSVNDLMRSAGLAGATEGAVMIDSTHPEFVVAGPDATSDMCLRLIERVRDQIRSQMDLDLRLTLQIW